MYTCEYEGPTHQGAQVSGFRRRTVQGPCSRPGVWLGKPSVGFTSPCCTPGAQVLTWH